jgi:cytochrome P450
MIRMTIVDRETTPVLAHPEIIDPRYYEANGYPHEIWRELRQKAPIAYCDFEGFLPFWAVTKRADIVRISKDPLRFLNGPLLAVTKLAQGQDPYRQTLRHLLNMDLPDHRTYRRLLSPGFTPRAVRPQLQTYEALADDILDGVEGKDVIDFVTEVSAILPIRVIADIMGVPAEDRQQLFVWTNEIIGAGDPEFRHLDASPRATFMKAIEEQRDYFKRMVEERRRHPTEDLTSALANATIDGA